MLFYLLYILILLLFFSLLFGLVRIFLKLVYFVKGFLTRYNIDAYHHSDCQL